MDDWALLRRYAESGCEEAFATLVKRHIHYVHSVARRECVSAQQAEEVTQAAFIILARKAGRLRAGTVLSGWLFRTVRFAAKNARRAEQRRLSHEEEAAQMSTNDSSEEAIWDQIAPLLNDGLAALSRADRDAITLRFFEKKSHAELATALRTNEPAARKRLSRALERLRAWFSGRGVAVPVAALAAVLSSRAVEAAPLALASGVASAAVQAGSANSALVAATLQFMAWSKIKFAAVAAIALLVAGGASVGVMKILPLADEPLSRKLPDGSVFTVTQVELGSRADFSFPEGPGKKGGRTSGSIRIASADAAETLFIGTTQVGGNGRCDVGRLQVESDDGSVFDGVFPGGTLGTSEGVLQAWRVFAFPRRGRELTLRFFYAERDGTWAEAAAMTVPNPVSGPFEDWKANAWPAAQTNGNLVVSLMEFEAGGAQRRFRSGLSGFWKRLPGTHCAFAVQQTGRTLAPWTVRSLQFSDATGNRWKPDNFVCWAEDEAEPRLHTSMPGALWANEPAWDVRVELSRTNDFAPEELLTLKNIPVPPPGEVIELRDMHFVNGLDVEVRSIADATAELEQSHKWLQEKGKMNLALTLHGESEGKRVSLVSVRDDRGRPVPFKDRPETYTRRELVFGFEAPEGAKSLEFKVAVHESRFVEFRAKPVQAAGLPIRK